MFFATQWFSWNDKSECWVAAQLEYSKLFKCDDSSPISERTSFETPTAPDNNVLPGSVRPADPDPLFYRVPDSSEISVALCIVGEARLSTFQRFGEHPPVSTAADALHARRLFEAIANMSTKA